MKIKYLFFFTIFTLFSNAQVVTISNVNFKNALIISLCVDADLNGTYESDADLNNDGQIQLTEAQAVQRLKVSNKSISLLTGISSFTNLKVLLCDNNLLSTNTLSLSNLTNLTTLDCSHNALTALNLAPTFSTLTNLVSLNCSYNQLTSINIADINLTNLNASNNNLTSISQSTSNFGALTDLDISNNQFTTFTVNGENLVNFIYANNPLTQLYFYSYGNSPINITNIPTLQSITFHSISIPSLTLSQLPNLNFFKVYYSNIVSDVLLTNLPSLNSVDFQSNTSSLTLGANLGFTSMINGYQTPNTVNIRAVNFHITNCATVTDINLFSFNAVNFSIDNMVNLTSLKIPDGEFLQTMSFSTMPQLQTLEIGSTNSTINTNCVDLNISNFNNLNTFTIKRINLGNLTLSSLPSLVNFTNNGTSCDATASSLLLTNLPLLYDVKIFDLNLAIVNINNLNSLYNLELNCKKITSLNLVALPQLYNFKYNDFSSPNTSALPMLTIQNLPNLYSIYLSRMDIGGINLNNLNNLYSLIITNDQPSSSYTPQTINYSFSNFPNLNYVQLDEIKTTNLSFQNVPNLTTLKFRKSTIGTSYSIQNLPLENVFIDDMSTLNNLTFNNLPNFKNLNITQCSNIQSLNLGNTNTTLESFVLKSTNFIPSTSISSLNFTNFPQLNSLTVNYYLPTLTLNNLPNLTYLNCSSNKLNALSLVDFPQLNELVCNVNQPVNTSPAYKWPLTLNLPQLTKLDVNYNNARLANLDLSNCPLLNEIHYKLSNSNNTGIIPYLNLKNGNPNFSIFESNAIANMCVDSSAEKTVLQGLNTNLQSTIFTTYCNFNPGGTFYSFQGNSKLDGNLNGCDTNDILFPMINFSVQSGGITSSYFADTTGNYSIPVIAGQYVVTPVFENPSYYTFSPTSVTLNFPTDASPINQPFCVTPNGNHNDLEITLIPYIPARPGFDAIYKLNYKNKGNQVQSGTVNLNFNDALIDFVSANPTVASQAVNLLSWSFTNLQPFENRTITATFNVNSPTEIPAVVSGTILNYTAQVIGMTDDTPADNSCVLSQSVVNAFDPNDKTCLEGPIVTSSLIGDYVHYVVRFQNTGTANAQNIVVKDLIDLTKFDLTTLIPMTGSHSFSTRITNTNQVEFIFQNINLSYLTGNNNGYVAFKIKTKPTLTVGSTFNNYAEIYFDYNYPIITNNFSTTIQNPLANNQFESAKLSVYPNPVKDILYFKTNEDVLKVEVYDLAGRILSSSSVLENKIDLSNLNKGNYIIKIYSAETITNTKILKE